MTRARFPLLIVAGGALALAACTPASQNPRAQQGAVAGGLIGAVAGAATGEDAGERQRGALIGGLIGAGLGGAAAGG